MTHPSPLLTSLPAITEAGPDVSLPRLPVDYELALKTWFNSKTRQAAHRLLRDREAVQLVVYRQGAGLLLSDGVIATVQVVPGSKGQAFVFRDGYCSNCLASKRGCRCRHVAALVLLCLRESRAGLAAVGLSFPHSPWNTLGNYLYDRAAPLQVRTTLEEQSDHVVLHSSEQRAFDLTLRLSRPAASELLALYPGLTAPEGLRPDQVVQRELLDLRERLARQNATPGEQALMERGSLSRQQHRDRSLWMALATMLFFHIDPSQIRLDRDDEGIYRLLVPGREAPLMSLVLVRSHTWDLFSRFPAGQLPVTSLPPARSWAEVRFSQDGAAIEVRHHCTLEDGRSFALQDLQSVRYGTSYAVDNRFFRLEQVPRQEQILRPGSRQGSLLALAENKGQDWGFTVSGQEIERFLELNSRSLRCGRHRVEAEILELEFVSRPRRLTLTAYVEEQDWCYLAGYYDLGNQQIDLVELLTAGAEKQEYLPGRRWLRLNGSSLAWFHHLGRERIVRGEDGTARIRLRRQEFLALAGQIEEMTTRFNHRHRHSVLTFLLGRNEPVRQETPPLADHLRSYQQNGTRWLYLLQQHGLGGILADDMGLGKTHQALALLSLLADGTKRFLVVCPTAVLYHWPEKQQRFFPDLALTLYHGPGRDLERAAEADVVVTTYGILRLDVDKLASIQFELVIFDEMQHLKNRKTRMHQAARLLTARHVIGLTGTPVENSLQELQSLFDLCLPGLFDSRFFRQRFIHQDSPASRQELARIIRPFVLRRTREQVLEELPPCTEDIRLCRLHDDQVAAYRQAVAQAKSELQGNGPADFTSLLSTITRLKQICDHLCLLEKCDDWQRYRSGKWEEWCAILDVCLAAGLKLVVFSQFTSMLDLMEGYLAWREIPCVGLRGAMDAATRQQAIDRFNTDPQVRVCCASLLAGGTGIDLTGAQVVVHYDRWWNPAKEDQATARVYRMGQRQPVQVYKLVTAGTLEEKIHHLLEKKRILTGEIIGEDDGSVLKQLTRSDISALLSLRS